MSEIPFASPVLIEFSELLSTNDSWVETVQSDKKYRSFTVDPNSKENGRITIKIVTKWHSKKIELCFDFGSTILFEGAGKIWCNEGTILDKKVLGSEPNL